MTRETKIGLVLGLGFIVVFGILLSNRGAGEHLPPPSSSGTAPIVPPEIVLTGDVVSPSEPVDVEDAAEVQLASADPSDAANDIELPVIGPGISQTPSITRESAEEQVAALEPTPEASAPSETEVSSSALGVTIQGPEPGAIPASDRGSQPAPTRSTGLPEHRIAQGDTLSSLARQYYGTASPNAIEAIYKANRSVLRKGPHDLKLNQQLTIPEWAPAEKFEPAPAPPAAQVVNRRAVAAAPSPLISTGNASTVDTGNALSSVIENAPATAATEAEWDWYEMGPNETLYGVAAKRLGSPRRWREIHELNKSDHPDPRRIRMGARIKLPRT